MRKRDTWTDAGGLILCTECGSGRTEICDVRIKSGLYDRHTRCLDCGELRTVKLAASSSLRDPYNLDRVRAWWDTNAGAGYTSASGARACSIALDIPLNTVRGLQRDAYLGDETPPWKATQAPLAATQADDEDEEDDELDRTPCDRCTIDWAVELLPRPLCADCASELSKEEEPRRDRVADAAAGRAAARQPRPPKRTKRYTIDDDGLFQPVKAGEPLHVCPTCGAQAFIHYELAAGFGIRNMGGVLRPQSLCRVCRTAHGRQRRKMQLDLIDNSEQAGPLRAMKQGELDEIARLAAASLRNGAAMVELLVKDDPKVALALDADTVASALYPLCPEGPLGLIVSCDHKSDTGTLRLRFDAIELRDWAVAQGAQILTAPPAAASESQARSAYQNPPGLAELVGGRR